MSPGGAEYRDGHKVMDASEVLYWLATGDYTIARFSGGHGLMNKVVGGLWGYFK